MLVKKLSPLAQLPKYQSEGAAGMDLHAAIDSTWTLHPGERLPVPIGIAVSIAPGYEGQIRPRSGLALKHRVTVLNAPGTIDSDYRGEVGVILINHGESEFDIRPGDRVAQLVIAPVVQVSVVEVDDLPGTERGTDGFGSTGR